MATEKATLKQCCRCPPYASDNLQPQSEDSALRRELKTFFREQVQLGYTLHERSCTGRYPRALSKHVVWRVASQLLPPDGYEIQKQFMLHRVESSQMQFWEIMEAKFRWRKTLKLYTWCVPLIPHGLRASVSESVSTLLATTLKRPIHTVAHRNEPSAKRQRIAEPRKCGFCRRIGHTIRHCDAPGIAEFRAGQRKKKVRIVPKRKTVPEPPPQALPVSTRCQVVDDPLPRIKLVPLLQQHLPRETVDKMLAGWQPTEVDLNAVWSGLPFRLTLRFEIPELQASQSDSDMEITAVYRAYPRCPLSQRPLRWPVFGDECQHGAQAFDLSSLLELWSDLLHATKPRPKWDQCPVCKNSLRPGLLHRSREVEAALETQRQTQVVMPPQKSPTEIIELD